MSDPVGDLVGYTGQPTLFDDDVPDAVDVDPASDATRIRARVCHPSGTPRLRVNAPDVTAAELRDAVAALTHRDLVAVIMTLCTGTYPRIARDSVITELARRDLVGGTKAVSRTPRARRDSGTHGIP